MSRRIGVVKVGRSLWNRPVPVSMTAAIELDDDRSAETIADKT